MIIESQKGKKVYSDGNETELNMLKIAQKYPEDLSQDFIAQNNNYTINNTFSSVRRNILNWYPFREGSSVLEIGAGMGAVTGLLCDKCKSVTAIEMNELRADIIRARYPHRDNLVVISEDINYWNSNEKFDYVVFIGVLEYAGCFSDSSRPFQDFLSSAKRLLKDNGILLFAIENRFGIKYWCGASEDHLQTPFVGLEGYLQPKTPKTFSKAELETMLQDVGFDYNRFYYTLPDYKFPQVIFTDEYSPRYNDLEKIPFTYAKNSLLFVNEKKLYKDILENKVFSFFANSFLIEASMEKLPEKHVIHVSARGESKKKYRIITTIDSDHRVTKATAHEEALTHLKKTYTNHKYLKQCGISVLNADWENDKMVYSFYHGTKADEVFSQCLAENDFKGICSLAELLKEALLKSSPKSQSSENIITQTNLSEDAFDYGIILEKGFIDMTLYNAFYDNGVLTFYDQEWCFDQVPLNFILYYALKTAYRRADVFTNIFWENIQDYLHVGEEFKVYDKLEDFIWSTVLYRQGDIYGGDGYCNIYNESLTLNHALESIKELPYLRQELLNQSGHIQQLLESERQLKSTIEVKQVEMDAIVEEKQKKLQIKIQEMTPLQVELNNKNGHIRILLESDRELERIKASRSWRYMGYIWKLRDIFVPQGSKRRLGIKMTVKCVKMPLRVLRKLSPARIRKFFYYLKREGVSGVSKRIDCCLAGTDIQQQLLQINQVGSEFIKNIGEYEKISFTTWDNPTVSIIIPVHNQFSYTYNCLESIWLNSGEVSYEIIVANDCSTDMTTRITEVVSGITVITNEENLRFLRNCNNASRYAKGKYILFLNNDTQVQKNWLEPLISLIESDEKIGMVGSKLVYADGRLQEAGGMIWKDASAWNYGNRSDPNAPEYNYVKEVDYISGASIMISRDLWETVGGFDERFVPAYCEDSDIAFEVRKRGYKVMYQPKSVVVHFEGISNGTDTSTGQKAYQAINQKRFYEKWKNVLQNEHFNNGENVFLARDRSRNKKTILVIDHYVPTFDKDAGSRTVYQYLKLFVGKGYNVKFIGDNFYPEEPYTTTLQQMGIEVLYGSYYANHWKSWIREHAKDIDYVLLNRPHISVKYIDFVKAHTKAKIFYYGHDLHFLREKREYELTGDKTVLKSSLAWRKKEINLMKKADYAYYPSRIEEEEIKKIDDSINVKAIPAYLFEDIIKEPYHFENRKDIMFIGGFSHKPNIDAVVWLAKEIMPILLELNSMLKIYILGSNPPECIKALASENLIVKGFVGDEELENFYKTCRISIVPLRYGAGIKGKVIEAMKFGMPVVTTSIGAEGIEGAENILSIENNATALAQKIARLYQDEKALSEKSEKSHAYIEENYTPQKALKIIGRDFDMNEGGESYDNSIQSTP